MFGHDINLKMVSAAGVDFPSPAIWLPEVELFAIANSRAPAITRAQTSMLATTLRADGGPEGICTLNPPADNGALC